MEFKNLKRVAINELKKLDTAYASKDEFSAEDLKTYDCLMHGLKSQLTSEAMLEAEEYEEEGGKGMSGRQMRGTNGQYMSRTGNRSYSDGYAQGYSEAMRQSGHYPFIGYPAPMDRNW